LEIERGRYQRPKPLAADQWLCQAAKNWVAHFLMSCSNYAEERLKLFDIAAYFIPFFIYCDPQLQFELYINELY